MALRLGVLCVLALAGRRQALAAEIGAAAPQSVVASEEPAHQRRHMLSARPIAGPNPLSVYLVGNLRTFMWMAPRVLELLMSPSGFKAVPFIVFMHTWTNLESPDEAWWKSAQEHYNPASYVHAILSDRSTNPFLDACHPSVGMGKCFVHVVETYSPDKIQTPHWYNRSRHLQISSNRTHKYWRLWSLYVQKYVLKQVHTLANRYFDEHLKRSRHASDLVLKSRPDADILRIPPLETMQSRIAIVPHTVFGASYRGGVSDVAFVTSVAVLRSLTEDSSFDGVVETLRPEHIFQHTLRRLRIARVLGDFRLHLCRLVFGSGLLEVIVGNHPFSLGECYRKG